MSTFSVIQNPMLDNPSQPPRTRSRVLNTLASMPLMPVPSFRNLVNRSLLHMQQHMKNNRKIAPVVSQSKTEGPKLAKIAMADSKQEPVVFYNGPFQTSDQLSADKLSWIKAVSAEEPAQNPLTEYKCSVVFRKSFTRSKTYPIAGHTQSYLKPKAMFYLRVLQITGQKEQKNYNLRCVIKVNDETFMGKYAKIEKCGKHNIQANFEETYLVDIEDPTVVSLNLYAQPKGKAMFSSENRRQDRCIGSVSFNVNLFSEQKRLQRFSIINYSDNDCQPTGYELLAVTGTYVSSKSQALIQNRALYDDYVNIYINSKGVPRIERYRAILRGALLELHDFQTQQV
ncbi:uncharacterized protein BYT42DRAFT_341441 [Radiomyces spectabilis]|uniref:uncharacterized protein n=1 Tax=Radiomyces spectabilis TaxID=64574 RepID=UPI00221F095D|nr:uncharacterized protein BYT42DRAFT_341441 [Radiomyces spectabilis]KAI8379806.1 hypothetical protein BYT42DRAFT_341441 [Radiomyces spectabilis]